MTDLFAQILPIFAAAQNAVLTTHVNPDGDGLGCELALAEWLRQRGCSASIINHSTVPYFYRFLDPDDSIARFDPTLHGVRIAQADLILLLDMNQPERLRSMQDAVTASRATKVCIDHHLDPLPFADHYVIDAEATSTGEIIYRLLRELGGGFTPTIARSLYAAIMTDTGSFRYPRVDSETHRIVADLIEKGADPVSIYSEIFERWSTGRIHLLGEMLAGMESRAGGQIVSVSVTQEMLSRTSTSEVDTDNFTTFPMSVEGAKIGILFLELKDGVKISVRSKGEIPINELAKEFGGNGHKNAAGARLFHIPLSETRDRVLAAASKYLAKEGGAKA
ncbi:MAG: bifunctional oligoribonuclease/PAP phosphatase NrnA [Bacteroidota bacterium]